MRARARARGGAIVLGGRRAAEDEEEDDEAEAGAAGEAITPAQARRVLAAVCGLLRRVAGGASVAQSPAAPELLAPFAAALAAARLEGVEGEAVREARAAVAAAVAQGRAGRQPLQWRRKGLPGAVASLAPRIIDNFVVRKDEGLDREAAKRKQLIRQVKREKKGAMRELRRDAAFLDAEQVAAQREREAERRRVVKENMAWLQEQQASINQQVKKTKGEALRGGGSGVKKGMLTR